MQDISSLIKEAKPLYLAKKKMKQRTLSAVGLFGCLALLIVNIPQKSVIDDLDYWTLGEENDSEYISYVENFGFPVDDYGLLSVS